VENSTSITDLIVWASPLVGALALYLAHDAFTSVKEDLKDLRERQVKTREDMAELRSETRAVGDAVRLVNQTIDATSESVRRLDDRSGNTKEMAIFIREMKNKLKEHDENYGKVLMVLKKVVTILKPKS
jgi:hypothetical protein